MTHGATLENAKSALQAIIEELAAVTDETANNHVEGHVSMAIEYIKAAAGYVDSALESDSSVTPSPAP